MEFVTFTDDYEVGDVSADPETPISEPGEILLEETEVDIKQEVGEIQNQDIVLEPNIITYQDDIISLESDLIELAPVDIGEIPLMNYDLESVEENSEFDETNILVSLSSIRDAVKSGTAESIESNEDTISYLKSIESQATYTNYLLAMLIGIIVVKIVFEKILP